MKKLIKITFVLIIISIVISCSKEELAPEPRIENNECANLSSLILTEVTADSITVYNLIIGDWIKDSTVSISGDTCTKTIFPWNGPFPYQFTSNPPGPDTVLINGNPLTWIYSHTEKKISFSAPLSTPFSLFIINQNTMITKSNIYTNPDGFLETKYKYYSK